MPTISIRLHEETDSVAALKGFEEVAARMGLSRADRRMVGEAVQTLAQHGEQLVSSGGTLRTTRTIICGILQVVIRADYGRKRGLLRRVRDALVSATGK